MKGYGCEDMEEMEGMMSKMMEGHSPDMMMEMMPKCLGMMLSKLSGDQRSEIAKKLFSVLWEAGNTGGTEDKQESVLDNRTKELIAIGASVTANCQTCLKYHVGEAKKLKVGDKEIQEAVETGQMVKKGAMRKYNEFISTSLGSEKSPVNESRCGS